MEDRTDEMGLFVGLMAQKHLHWTEQIVHFMQQLFQ